MTSVPWSRGALALLLLSAACSAGAPGGASSDDTTEAVDYRSTLGSEFDVRAPLQVTLAGDDLALTGAARAAKARDLAHARRDAVTEALGAKLLELAPNDDRTKPDGYGVQLRALTTGFSDPVEGPAGTFQAEYRAELGGPTDLLTKLRLEGTGETRTMTVTVSGAPLVLRLAAQPRTGDAYPRYMELFEGGLDIGIHIGGDYNTPRGDTPEAKATYDELLALGLQSPVAKFEDLALDSGPFKGQLDVDGRKVAVRATMFHAEMIKDGNFEKLVDAYKASAKTNDVVLYRGHSGLSLDYSGVIVNYNPRVALPASEFANLELPTKYQVFVFDGCETYYGYADKVYANTRKARKDTSIVTTVNYAGGSTAEASRAFLRGMLDQTKRTWTPHSWDGLLKRLNDPDNAYWAAIYGVHGLEGAPKVSPLAKTDTIGKACRADDDCPGVDNLCVKLTSSRVCGAACTDDAGCPTGNACTQVRRGAGVKQCLPR